MKMTSVSQRTRFTLGLLIAVTLGGLIVHVPGLIALIAPGLLGGMVIALLVRTLFQNTDGPIQWRRIMWWAFVIFVSHLLLGLFVTHFPSPFNFLRSDSGTYNRGAQALVNHWTAGAPAPRFPGGKEGYYFTLAGLYRVLGPHASAGIALNATLAAIGALLTTDSTRRLFGEKAAGYVMPISALSPGLLMWTSPLLKEAGVLFLISLSINCAVRLVQRLSFVSAAALALGIGLLFTYRGAVAFVAAGGLVIGMVLAKGRLIGGLGTGLSAAAAVTVMVLSFGVGLTGYRSAVKQSDLQRVSIARLDLATTARSGFDADVDVSTPSRALTYLPRGLFNFMLGPMPWQIKSAAQATAIPDVAVWWFLLPSLVRGIRTARRVSHYRFLMIILPAFTVSLVLSLVVGNFGLVVRERTQVVVLLLPLIALGLAVRAERRTKEHAEPERVSPTPVAV